MDEPDFGGEYLPYAQDGVVSSDTPLFGTMVDGVYVVQDDIQIP